MIRRRAELGPRGTFNRLLELAASEVGATKRGRPGLVNRRLGTGFLAATLFVHERIDCSRQVLTRIV